MERRKMISIPIWYSDESIYFIEDALVSISDFNNWTMYKLQMIWWIIHTVNKTQEVKDILNSIWYNL